MLVAGVDIGAQSAKAVILRNGEIQAYSIFLTGRDVVQAGERVIKEALAKVQLSISDLSYIVATGYGRYSFPFDKETVTEITCHAVGAKWLITATRTVIDIGGQDSKVIRIDEKGNVTNFVMNDKCAAGAGRFLEVMAGALDLQLTDTGTISLRSSNPCIISSTCTVFVESEVISLRAERKPIEDILAGIHKSIAKRVAAMGSQIGYEEPVVFTGGTAKNLGVVRALEKEIKTKIIVPEEPQIVGALGAALLADLRLRKDSELKRNGAEVKEKVFR